MNRLNPIMFAVSMWLCVIGVGLIAFSGCGGCASGKGQLNPATGVYSTDVAADTVVVTAEKLRETALIVFDMAMKTEHENEAALRTLDPRIHESVELIRRDGSKWLDDLTAAKAAYQSARTSDNMSKLHSAFAVLTSALASASREIAAAATTRKAP